MRQLKRQTNKYFFSYFPVTSICIYKDSEKASCFHGLSTTAQCVDPRGVSDSTQTSQLLEERLGIKQDIRKPT